MSEMTESTYKHLASLMVRMTPRIADLEDRVKFFQPIFFLWKKAENDLRYLEQSADADYINRLRVQIRWELNKLHVGDRAEADEFAEGIANLVGEKDFRLLTAVWETLWNNEFVKKVLS